MSIVSYDPRRGATFATPPDELSRLAAMTDAEIEAAALADPDNPPIDEARLHRMTAARTARLAEKLSTNDAKSTNEAV